MWDNLKRIDAFPKASDDVRVKTTTGAIVSIISVLIMAILFVSEMSYFLKTETVDHLYVNTTRADSLKVDFDISFHDLPCNLLSVDAVDDAGNPQKDAVHDIYKHRLSVHGDKQGLPEKQELGNTLQNEPQLEEMAKENAARMDVVKQQIGDCGNCYGAGTPGQCCPTCQDVKQAYQRMGWRFKPHGIVQCASEAFLSNMKEQFAEDGGCQLYGSLTLNPGSGHFHIAPHKKLHSGGGAQSAGLFNLMDLISFTFDQFNISHTINTLSFGDNFPGISSPLDGQTRMVVDTHGMYQYYIKVVPTRYKPLYGGSGSTVGSNQGGNNLGMFTSMMNSILGTGATITTTTSSFDDTATAGSSNATTTTTTTKKKRSNTKDNSNNNYNNEYYIQSNQYSVTEHMSHLSPGSGRGLPGIYFNYEVSPVQALFEEKRGGMIGFLTSICAIIGGAYSVMGLVDLFLNFLMGFFCKGGIPQ